MNPPPGKTVFKNLLDDLGITKMGVWFPYTGNGSFDLMEDSNPGVSGHFTGTQWSTTKLVQGGNVWNL